LFDLIQRINSTGNAVAVVVQTELIKTSSWLMT